MYFLEVLDGSRSPDRRAKKDYAWAVRSLSEAADRGYATEDDPQLIATAQKMLTHPLMAGVRIRFKDDRVKPIKPKPQDGDITAEFAEGDLDAPVSRDVRLA